MIGFGAFLAFLLSGPAAGAPTAEPSAQPAVQQVEQEVAACQSRCATDPGLSDTDRASCKLNCTSARRAHQLRTQGIRHETSGTGPRPTGTYTTVIEQTRSPAQIAACQLGCDQAGLASTDRATCKLNCAATTRIVHVVSAAPPSTSAAGTGTGASPTPTGAGASPAPAGGAALAACFDGCAALGASDKVTCRLNCESAHRVRSASSTSSASPTSPRPGAPASSSSVVHRPSGDATATAGCERSCAARLDLSETDRATCKLGCSRHTTVVVEQWTSAAPASPDACQAGCHCRDRCLGHQQTCAQSCSGKSGSDAATCSLQCEAVFDSCQNACKVDGCSCGTKPVPH